MSYLVLARKYRPQSFREVTGQGHVTTALTNAVVRDRVPHALLFSGPRGVGKTSCARILAKVLNCTGRDISPEDVSPCEKCSNCVDITRGNNLAVVEIDGASNNSVEDVRSLIETLYISPPPGIAYKMYIIDEVHMLSTSAFNALLKSIEEPPANTIFILATTEAHKIPDTVKSRCQEHTFKRLLVKDIVSQLNNILVKEGVEVEKEVVRILANTADGGMRDASSLLDRVLALSSSDLTPSYVAEVLGTLDNSYFLDLLSSILEEDESFALSKISFAFNRGLDIRAFLSDFVASLRIAFLFSLAARRGEQARERFAELEELSDVQVEKLNELVLRQASDYFSILFDMGREIAEVCVRSEFPQAVMEAGVVKLCFCSRVLSVRDSLDGRVGAGANTVPRVSTSLAPTESTSLKKISSEPIPRTPEVKTAETLSEDQVESGPLNWNGFLGYLKEQGQLLLVTYLNRVAPEEFSIKGNLGHLRVKGTSFVLDNFKDKSSDESLKKYLFQFSGVSTWRVSFSEVDSSDSPTIGSPTNESVRGSNPVKGSKQAIVEDKRRVARARIETEAKDKVAVKSVMDAFQGTVIDKVVPETRK